MVSATSDLDRAYIHVEALQQLAQHLALRGNEAGMEFAFHAFKVLPGNIATAKCVDVRTQPFQCMGCPCITAGGHRGDMKYWHRGSPPQRLSFRIEHCCRGPLPRLSSFPALFLTKCHGAAYRKKQLK